MEKSNKVNLFNKCSVEVYLLHDNKFLMVDHSGNSRVADSVDETLKTIGNAFRQYLSEGDQKMATQEKIKSKFSVTIHWLGDEDFLLVDSEGNQKSSEDLEEMTAMVGTCFDELVSKEEDS